MSDRTFTAQDMWRAFAAGFGESGEGFNGEYVSEAYRGEGKLEARLRPVLDKLLDAPSEAQDAKVAAAALDALRAADFPYTERVDRLAEMLAERWAA